EPRRLDLGPAQARGTAAERSGGARDLHLRLPLPRLSQSSRPALARARLPDIGRPTPLVLARPRPSAGAAAYGCLHKAGRTHTADVALHKRPGYAASHHEANRAGASHVL